MSPLLYRHSLTFSSTTLAEIGAQTPTIPPLLELCNAMDCSPPGSSVHGDSPGKNTGVGCHALLQGIFSTQESNPGLPALLSEPPAKPRNWTHSSPNLYVLLGFLFFSFENHQDSHGNKGPNLGIILVSCFILSPSSVTYNYLLLFLVLLLFRGLLLFIAVFFSESHLTSTFTDSVNTLSQDHSSGHPILIHLLHCYLGYLTSDTKLVILVNDLKPFNSFLYLQNKFQTYYSTWPSMIW